METDVNITYQVMGRQQIMLEDIVATQKNKRMDRHVCWEYVRMF